MRTGMTGLARALAAACLAAMPIDAALARCSVPNFSFWLGNPGSAVMNADSGQPCKIRVWSGIGSDFRSVTTLRAPSQGAVTGGGSDMFYRSRPGFSGTDSFVIAIKGTKFGAERTTELTVNVTVGPAKPGASAATPAVRHAAVAPARPSRAARQPAATSSLNAMCLQKVGASRDPVTGRWMFHTDGRDGMGRNDMYRMCLAGGDRAKANAVTVPEFRGVHPGDRWPYHR